MQIFRTAPFRPAAARAAYSNAPASDSTRFPADALRPTWARSQFRTAAFQAAALARGMGLGVFRGGSGCCEPLPPEWARSVRLRVCRAGERQRVRLSIPPLWIRGSSGLVAFDRYINSEQPCVIGCLRIFLQRLLNHPGPAYASPFVKAGIHHLRVAIWLMNLEK